MKKIKFCQHKTNFSDLLLFLRETFKINNFVETGTHAAATTKIAAEIFNVVHSVELETTLFNKAFEALKDYNNTLLHFGSSGHVLNSVIPMLTGQTMFWLDAHYCGKGTAFGDSQTPIREELEAIKKSGVSDSIIMIDDIRIFGSRVDNKEYIFNDEYPSIQWINERLLKINKNYVVYLIGDILLAYDRTKFDLEVSEIVKACTISRLYDGYNYPLQEVMAAENKIKEIDDEEFALIKLIAEDQLEVIKELNIQGNILYCYYFWYGLGLTNRDDEKSKAFLKIIEECLK